MKRDELTGADLMEGRVQTSRERRKIIEAAFSADRCEMLNLRMLLHAAEVSLLDAVEKRVGFRPHLGELPSIFQTPAKGLRLCEKPGQKKPQTRND